MTSSTGYSGGPSGRRATISPRSSSTPAPVAAEIGDDLVERARAAAASASCGSSAWPRTASTLFTTQIAGRAGGRDLLLVDEGIAPADAGGAIHHLHDHVDPVDRVAHEIVQPQPRAGSWACGTPGVSVNTICAPSAFQIARMSRRVVCGLSDTIATFCPTSAFTRVDLPTFGRPTTATIAAAEPARRSSPRIPLERGRQELRERPHETLACERLATTTSALGPELPEHLPARAAGRRRARRRRSRWRSRRAVAARRRASPPTRVAFGADRRPGELAFSTLPPVKMSRRRRAAAAPTAKPEYGA